MLHLEINQQSKIIHGLEQTKRKVFEDNQELLLNYEEKDIQLQERTKKWYPFAAFPNCMILTLNDPNAMPVVLSKPILLSPNIKTAIKVLKQVVTRQPAPYVTQCSDQYPDTYLQNPILSSLIDFSSVRYTEDYCKSTCRVQYVNETCGCLDPLLLEALFLEKVTTKNLQFCSVVHNSTSRNCSTYALEEYAKNKGENCPCKPSCYVENYEVSSI